MMATEAATDARAAAEAFHLTPVADPVHAAADEAERKAEWLWERQWGPPPACPCCLAPVQMVVASFKIG